MTEKEMEKAVERLANEIGELVDGEECNLVVNALTHILARVVLFGVDAYGTSRRGLRQRARFLRRCR
jgi:hypothetical protein